MAGELQTNVTMDAEDMLLREFLGVRRARRDRALGGVDPLPAARRRHVGELPRRPRRSVDDDRGLLGAAPGRRLRRRPSTCASRPSSSARRAASRRRACSRTCGWRCSGCGRGTACRRCRRRSILLPSWVPLNVYDFACWARQTIVALSLVKAHRPVRPLPFDLDELRWSRRAPAAPRRRPRARALAALARPRRCASTSASRCGRCGALALARAERWIVRRQEADGSWGGIQPPWVYSLIALHLCGYPLDHPVMRRGLEGIDRFMVEDRDDRRGVGAPAGASRRLEACQSPVWDTALALIALSDAGLAADHPALVRAAEWLLGEEVTVRGDWSVARPQLAPGGWAFEFANVNYPDVDDTAEVVLALRRVDSRERAKLDARRRARGARWLRGHAERRTAAGARSTPRTRARSCASCRSWTSAR